MTPAPGFPTLKATRVRRLLERELGYRALPRRGKGQHEVLVSEGRPRLVWGYGKREMSGIEVRRLLVKDIGLTIEEAKEVVAGA